LLRCGLAAGVDGKSVHVSVTLSGSPAATRKRKSRVSFTDPSGKPAASSRTQSLRRSPVNDNTSSSSTRPQPWQLDGIAGVVASIECAELTSAAFSSAADGVSRSAALAWPEG
jgi:hypothetical protein